MRYGHSWTKSSLWIHNRKYIRNIRAQRETKNIYKKSGVVLDSYELVCPKIIWFFGCFTKISFVNPICGFHIAKDETSKFNQIIFSNRRNWFRCEILTHLPIPYPISCWICCMPYLPQLDKNRPAHYAINHR